MKLDWRDPIEFAKDYAGYESLVFLHSSLQHPEYGTLSILAVNQTNEVRDWKSLTAKLQTSSTEWNHRWFGFMGYELGQNSSLKPSTITLPQLYFAQFRTVFIFNHQQQTLHRYGEDSPKQPISNGVIPLVATLHSNMDKASYLNAVEQTLEQIAAGEFYQANITRKFFGEFESAPDSYQLFGKLCQISPACYSAYIKVDDCTIISSSPECFLTIDESGIIESRPIKGTAPRDSDAADLANSVKDRAENLMIVDLMRNDLSLHCEAGSVETHNLFEVTSYATLHHMASTVTGKRKANSSSLEVISGCFPPGSMTGAPKKAVIQWCEQMEKQQRGIYSGSIGWLAPDGQADLSVIIRTLIVQDTKFEFQVGGGIVADSEPEKEWRETLTKAQAIQQCLTIQNSVLEGL